MPMTLHAAYVPSALQMLGTGQHLINKAEEWCTEQKCDPADVIGARLIEDMLPFTYQVKCIAEHTAGSIAGVQAGVYSPDLNPPPASFAELRTKLSDAAAVMEALDEAEMESWIGRDMRFEFKEARMDFTAEDFLLSFSQPNFYFHASTAYDILRKLGVGVGKRDFLGVPRLKA